MYKVLLWDIDNTLLDFSLAEKNSLKAGFKKFDLGECSGATVKEYSKINAKYWQMLEKGEITKEETMTGRFREFFSKKGICEVSPEEFNEFFENSISDTYEFQNNGYEIVSSLKGRFKQYAVTNGAYAVQKNRLEKSGLYNIFDGVFISDEIGFEKPNKEFFDYVKNALNCNISEVILIGDSLTSDIKGAVNSGIKCVWYNPEKHVNSTPFKHDFEVQSLSEIYKIIEE